MKRQWKKIGTLLLVVFVLFSLGVTASADDTPTPITEITIDKTVTVGENLSNPAATFSFSITPQFSSAAWANALTWDDDEQTTVTVAAGTTTTVPIKLKIDASKFSGAGWYQFVVEEVAGTNAVPGYTYDTEKKYVWLHIDGNPAYNSADTNPVAKYICTAVIVTNSAAAPNPDAETGVVAGKIGGTGTGKGIPFNNLYTKKNPDDPTDPDEPPSGDLYDVDVSKVVTGNQGDKTKTFNFRVTLDGIKAARTLIITTSTGASQTVDVTPGVETVKDITLKHGESFTINGLIKDEAYRVTETNAAEYVTTIVANGTTITGPTTYGVIKDTTGDVNLAFTNDKSGVIPTGLFLNYKPYWIMGGVALVLLMLLVVKRKKRPVADY